MLIARHLNFHLSDLFQKANVTVISATSILVDGLTDDFTDENSVNRDCNKWSHFNYRQTFSWVLGVMCHGWIRILKLPFEMQIA